MNSPVVGWALAVLAVAAGYVGYGWKGVVLAITVIVFWLLLQFSRALRVLRNAGNAPVGSVKSAVMFNARVTKGQRLPELLKLTGSLGRKVSDVPETWAWADSGGDAVHVTLVDGRVSAWELRRAPGGET
ncbi:MAG: hypothetical protein JNM33_10255 [Rubrivivax sp.]|nr:hypothetical protein [Rubrivivax sp.]